MNDIWRRIEAWLKTNAPGDFELASFTAHVIPAGATEAQIRAAEDKLQGERPWEETVKRLGLPLPKPGITIEGELKSGETIRLPAEVREPYKVHNGSRALFGSHELLPIDRIPDQWAMMRFRTSHVRSEYGLQLEGIRVAGPMKTKAWNPQWIPLTDTCGGVDYLCVDLDPAEGGQVGQVIYIDMEVQRGKVLAGSFRAWLSNFACELESGFFQWEADEYRAVRTSGEWFYKTSWYDPSARFES
jgi:cell wall assembly regulator SMI1